MFDASLNEHQRTLDRLQLAALGALMLIGCAFIYSATMVNNVPSLPWYSQSWFRQIVWYSLGIAAAIAVCLIDYRRVASWSLALYWLSILPLIAVLIPHIGTTHGWGAMRWIDLGYFQFQPSEFAKIGRAHV